MCARARVSVCVSEEINLNKKMFETFLSKKKVILLFLKILIIDENDFILFYQINVNTM